MKYRKISAELFRQRWFRELAPDLKNLFVFLHTDESTNNAGVFEIDPDTWGHFCGSRGFNEDTAFVEFGNRIKRIPNHPDKGICVGFIDFQKICGQNSTQWKWIEKDLSAVGLTYEDVQAMAAHYDEVQMELPLGLAPAKKEKKAEERRFVIPPKVEWVREYCSTRNNGVDPQRFFDYYESCRDKATGRWMVGKKFMTDWQAAVRTWEGNSKANRTQVTRVCETKSPVRKMF